MRSLLLLLAVFFSLNSVAQILTHPSLPTELSGHTCTFAGSEEFVICGGYNGEEFVKTALKSQIYDSSAWEELEEMNDIRYSHQATSLDSYDVFVSGGWDGDVINHTSTEFYSNEFDTWIEGPEMSVGRSDHRATKLDDGRVLITGGYTGDTNTNSVDIYDPETNTITAAAPMIYGRSSHTATLLSNGQVLVAGGFNPDYGFQMDECELYDPETDAWTETGSLNVARDNHAAPTYLYNTSSVEILVTGGRFYNATLNLFEGLVSCETYSISTGVWSEGADMPQGQSYHSLHEFQPVDFINVAGANNTGIGVTTTFSENSYGSDFSWDECCEYEAEGRYLAASGQTSDGFYFNPILVCGGVGNDTCELYDSDINVLELDEIEIKIYPNPTAEFVQINFLSKNQLVDVFIFDNQGKLVLEKLQWNASEIIDIKALTLGVYMLNIKSGDKVYQQKVVKM